MAAAPASVAPASGTASAPNWLAPQSAQQLASQATKTISSAYAPQYQNLAQQTKTAQGLSDKRSADNKYYLSWLDTQMSAIQAHADASNQALISAEQGLSNQQQGLYATQSADQVAAANARAGNVSNNAQSTPLTTGIQQSEAAGTGLLGSAEKNVLANAGTNTNALAATRANNYGFIGAAESKQLADLNTTLTSIGNARSTLATKQTADTAKEIARLQGVEIAKAQSNRNFDVAAQKLGVTVANTNSEIQTRAATTATGQKNAATAAQRAQDSQMNADRNYQLNVAKFNSATAKDIYQRDHQLGAYRPSSAGVVKPLSPTSQEAYYNKIDKVAGDANWIRQHFPNMTPAAVYSLLQRGGTLTIPGAPNPTTGKVPPQNRTFAPAGDMVILNAGFNVRQGGSGLSPGDVSTLKALGLTDPATRYGSYNLPTSAQNAPH